MTAASRAGLAYQHEFCRWLTTVGFPDAEPRVSNGSRDRGDVAGVRGWCLELKRTKASDLGVAMKEAEKEALNAGVTKFALVKKRRGKGVAESFVVMPAWLFAELIREDA